ncbi:hypothetical protein EVAR_61169_1 [Eumeta japonica]|uniref:Uncharacterized protein n=1 Tax=Eumeta variegata TaxID=151549 RepID=A0A4C1ZLY1_EUMVA|nr:hypothetical protein EVAR_61169_1 [Eumeta japonica]
MQEVVPRNIIAGTCRPRAEQRLGFFQASAATRVLDAYLYCEQTPCRRLAAIAQVASSQVTMIQHTITHICKLCTTSLAQRGRPIIVEWERDASIRRASLVR